MKPLRRSLLVLVTAMSLVAAVAPAADDVAEIRSFLQAYDRAFVAKDLAALAVFYHPGVTIFEGGGINRGWVDYRDHHLGPELKEFEGLEFGHKDVTPNVLQSGRTAYVTAEYFLKARMQGREIDATGIATMVLVREEKGVWKIRHSHTSSRRRPPASPSTAK